MKQFLFILISLILNYYSFGQEHPEALSKRHNLQQLRDFIPSKAGNMFDVKHYTLDLHADPSVSAISGTITTLFEMKSESNIISFDLYDNMMIDSIKYDDMLVETYTNNNHELSITLPASIEAGTLKSIAVSYHGSPISNGLGAFEISRHNDIPILWTLSAPYGAYTWWPCKQTLNDKADSVDIIVTVPSGNKVGSNGVLIATTDMENDQIQYHWKHRHAIATYLIAIAVTNYTELTSEVPVEGQDPIQIVDYVYPEQLNNWQASQNYTKKKEVVPKVLVLPSSAFPFCHSERQRKI